MKIFLAGATGFIGGHILRALSARGHTVDCLVRAPVATRANLETLPGVRIIAGQWTHPQSWLSVVTGYDVLINAVGVIRERRGASFEQVHTVTPLALFEAAYRAGTGKIVQISALGADEQARSSFHRTKRAADQYLMKSGTPYVILRPSLVYGPGAHSMTFFARLARLPVTPVPSDGRYRVQPLHVCDLVQAVLLAVQRSDLASVVADIGGGEVLTFDAMLDVFARQQGHRRGARKVHIPWPLMSLVAATTDLLGGHGPINVEELEMLRRENFTPNLAQFVALFGFEPVPFSQALSNAAWMQNPCS